MNRAIVYLIPSLLNEEGLKSIPPEIIDAVNLCNVFFTENHRTSRRFLKKLIPSFIIDEREWYSMENEEEAIKAFRDHIGKLSIIGIISEAGCPGIADPGQELVAIAHREGAEVRPLSGPSSIILALMASGMNGQQFRFVGYLPIREEMKQKAIRDLEADSLRNNSTQIFIEAPYRNNQLLQTLVSTCRPETLLSVSVNLTGKEQSIHTKSIREWKRIKPDLHKQPAIFCLLAVQI